MHKTKISWAEAKTDYLSEPTVGLRDIATRYGVSRTTVERHARVEGWSNARQEVGAAAAQKAAEEATETLSEINSRHQEAYKQAQEIANEYMHIIEQQILAEKEAAELEGRSYDPSKLPEPRQFYYLVQAVNTAVMGERVAVGLPTKAPEPSLVAVIGFKY